MSKLFAIYFSATGTTGKCVESFCHGFGAVDASRFAQMVPDIIPESPIHLLDSYLSQLSPSVKSHNGLLRSRGSDGLRATISDKAIN